MAWSLHGKYQLEPKQRCSSVRWAPFYYSSYRSACLRYITWYKTYKLDLAHPHNFPLQVAKTEQGTRKGKMEKNKQFVFFFFLPFFEIGPKNRGHFLGSKTGGHRSVTNGCITVRCPPVWDPKMTPFFLAYFVSGVSLFYIFFWVPFSKQLY